jgi:hypothetical protein
VTLTVDPAAPLVLADGTKIDPATGTKVKEPKERKQRFREVEAPSEAQAIVARARRSAAELPLAPKQMNVLSVVLMYTMWGMSTQDIAIVIGVTTDQVKRIRDLAEYKTMQTDIMSAVLEHEANDVRALFQRKAIDAAERIIEFSEEEGALGFAASKDILDRAGHRPADVVEHRHTMENALQIEYVRKSDVRELPMIDISPGAF